MKQTDPKNIDALLDAIVRLKTVEECRRFLGDLLTENELAEFSERWQAAQMLADGVPYVTIREKTGLSSRTIARVHKWLRQGSGGYLMMLDRVRKK